MPRDAAPAAVPVMPPFLRTAWVSDDARALWAPRLEQVRAALEELALVRALEGRAGPFAVRPAAVEPLQRLAAARGSRLEALEGPPAGRFDTAFGIAGRRWVGVGEAAAASALRVELCACPLCAARTDGAPADADPVWALALAAQDAAQDAGQDAAPADEGGWLSFAGDWACNPLLAPLGIAAAPGWPLDPACPERARLARSLQADGERAGHGEAMAWLRHILAWPMSWSSLHGVAEVKTPVLRYVRDTPYSATTLSVRWPGEATPALAAQGLGFPFSNPRAIRQVDHA